MTLREQPWALRVHLRPGSTGQCIVDAGYSITMVPESIMN